MGILRPVWMALVVLNVVSEPVQAQVLEARADTMTVPSTGLVFHPAEIILDNDVLAPDDSVLVLITAAPAHGTLSEVGNGFFRYQPSPGFIGEDAFRYALKTVALQRLAIDPSVSVLSFDATVETALGIAGDQEQIPVEGSIVVDMGDDPVAIDSVHVLGAAMQNQGPHSLNFNYGSPISVGSLRIIADPGSVRLSMLAAGPTSGVSGLLNSWEQTDNLVHVSVTAMLEGGGLISNQVPDEQQELETETTESLTGAVFTSGEQVLFLMNVASTNAFDLEGNAVTLDIQGALQASGVFSESQTSNDAEVRVQVVSGASAEESAIPSGLEFDVYPVPFRNRFTLQLRSVSGAVPGPTHFVVYDVLGRVVEHREMGLLQMGQEMNAAFDASNWTPGLYIVHVSGPSGSVTRPVVRY